MRDVSNEPAASASSTRLWPAHLNAALSGVGAGLVSTTLVVYLVNELGTSGFVLSLILAAPQFVGVGRIGAIRFTRRSIARKRVCIAAYLASAVILVALPTYALLADAVLAAGSSPPEYSLLPADLARAIQPLVPIDGRLVLPGIVVIWCGYHLFEYIGAVALWAWIKAIVPAGPMASFIGRRNCFLEMGRALGMIAVGAADLLSDKIHALGISGDSMLALLTFAGAGMLFLAAISLLLLPAAARANDADAATNAARESEQAAARVPFSWREAFTPLLDDRVSRLLMYGCWFSFFDGFTQPALGLFPTRMLGLGLAWILGMQLAMISGQSLVSPLVGRAIDRFGNRGVLFVSQIIVGVGLAGYLFAGQETWWLLGGAWLAWIAYAGINIGVLNLLLKLSPPGQAGACVAGYYALAGVSFGVSTIVGGLGFDMLQGQTMHVMGFELNRYQYLFYLGVATRIMGAGWLLRIPEPAEQTKVAT